MTDSDKEKSGLRERAVSGVKDLREKAQPRLKLGASHARGRLKAGYRWVRADRRRTIGAAVVVALVVGLLIAVDAILSSDALPGQGMVLSGFIEAEEIDLAAELGGRVVDLPFDEGDEVQAGDVLVQLSSGTMEAQLEAGQAALVIAQAQEDLLQEGMRDEVYAQVEASVMAAQAARDAAYHAWQDAIAIRDNPQEITLQMAQAWTQWSVAQYQEDAAQANYDRLAHIQWLYENQPGTVELYLQPKANSAIPSNERAAGDAAWQAQGALEAAKASLQGSSYTLGLFSDLQDDPKALELQVVNAEAAYKAAEANLAAAQASLDLIDAGASDEELASAEARREQAQATVNGLETTLQKLTIIAPANGVLLDQTVLPGELAVPGAPLVVLADLDEVKLTVFVPEDQLGDIFIGQEVRVKVDSFPGQTFEGAVTKIANEAEFTPRSVVTREERVSLVFAVTVRIPNPDHDLKPGMPADAVFSK